MDPATFFLNNRPGSRKAWDELSNDHKRKIRKFYHYTDADFDKEIRDCNTEEETISRSTTALICYWFNM
ncbi:uncharacterized protein LOC141527062 [Cotesia typhae]|uniref:uncharacterized protein LOC141527062 n=1 Tax=Cotesia typhae TaxID=2053667 RepID=UPI003D69A44F